MGFLQRENDAHSGASSDFIRRAEAAAAIADTHADAVDRDSRFPVETFEELRRQRLLGMLIPKALGGEGARTSDVANVCAVLAASCSSSGMIFAMHQVKVACLVRHHGDNPWLLQFMRDAAAHQWLLASSTTEGAGGGDIRSSQAPIEYDEGRVRLVRDASVISYGAEADAIVTTARRASEAANSDQALAVFRRQDYTLKPTQSWDTLGMRGTCSVGYLSARGRRGRPGPAGALRAHPHADHGALRAFVLEFDLARRRGRRVPARARLRAPRFTRRRRTDAAGRPASDQGARHAGDASRRDASGFGDLRARCGRARRRSTAMNTQLALNLLKVEASELAAATVMSAMRACGLAGYRNDSEFAMGRYLRDILSAPIMINNDRILANAEAARAHEPAAAVVG